MPSGYVNVAETRGKADPWGYIRDRDLEAIGDVLNEPEERARWARAFRVGGGLPYIWKQLASGILDIVWALLELQTGDRVLIVGEEVESCGWKEGVLGMVGASGTVDVFELIEEGNERIAAGTYGRNGMLGCWQWTYTHDTPDQTYDAVVIAQAAQHCDDWPEAAAEFLRVLKPGRRVVSAEALIPGAGGLTATVDADVHIQQWYDKLVSSRPVAVSEIPAYTAQEIRDWFGDQVQDGRAMEWRGIHMFWGRKPESETGGTLS
jgi:SAM-dependent methyltransferase